MKYCKKCGSETEHYEDGRCKPCTRACNASYRAANQEKIKTLGAAYRAANTEKERARKATWRAANQEAIKAYRAANQEAIKARRAAYKATSSLNYRAYHEAYYVANSEIIKARQATRRANKRECIRIDNQNRRARKREAGGRLSVGIQEKLFMLQKGKCACCGLPLGDDYHLDHIMPLALGGEHTDSNIQLLRQGCNLKKSAKHPVDFMQQRGFLL